MATSPPRSPLKGSPKKDVTRYGPIRSIEPQFGTEKRFKWQNSGDTSDVMYDVPVIQTTKSIIFGGSLRVGMDDENPDNKKRSTGPGSYDVAQCFNHNSEYVVKGGNRFACAPRDGMGLKTPSPGPVYNIEKCYWNGPIKNTGVGFLNETRDSMYGPSLGANCDMYFPKEERGPQITIAKRLKPKSLQAQTPGAIYDPQKKFNFQTGPSFSFGKGKGSRFKESNFG